MKPLLRNMFVSMLLATFISLLLTAGVTSATSRVGESGSSASRAAFNAGMQSSNSHVVTNRVLTAVAAVSAQNIWAVGYFFTSNGAPQTLTEQWNGAQWSIVKSPSVGIGDNYLYGVAAISANDIWTVGDYYSQGYYHNLIEQWNGAQWSVVTAPSMGPGSHLQGVVALSQNNVWIVGYYYNGSVFQTLIEHWNGSSWSIVSSPNVGTGDNYLISVAAISANNVWAVGHYDSGLETPGHTLVEQWNGTNWNVVASPNVGTNGSDLWSVAAVSASDIWAVGEYYNGGNFYPTLTEHWDGTQWSVIASPNIGMGGNFLNAVAAVSTNDVWAVGYDSLGQTLTLHWIGTQWAIVKSLNVGTGSNTLNGAAAVSAHDVWAVGNYIAPTPPAFRSLIERWSGKKWSIVKSPMLG